MSNNHTTRTAVTSDELESVYVWLAEAQQSIADNVPCDAGDCIERAMVELGLH
jgi:hypothetical protein